MKYAFVSDIHGNLQAWTQVWASLRAENVDGVICLGDIIGYGPRPAETLADVQSKVNFCVIGNHDAVIAGLEDASRFNEDAQRLVQWSAERLDQKAKDYFSSLPYELNIDTENEILGCVHGNPYEPEMFWYVSDAEEARMAWDSTEATITFIGHSHVPGFFTLSPANEVKYNKANDYLNPIQPGTRYIINAGSVGLSRDGDSRASYCIYDSEARSFYWRRVDFDLASYRMDVKTNMPDKSMAAYVLDNFELSVETQAIKKFSDFKPSEGQKRITISRKATIQTINVSKNSLRRKKTGSTQNMQPIQKEKPKNSSKTKLIVFLISALFLGVIIAAIFIFGHKSKKTEKKKSVNLNEQPTAPKPDKKTPPVQKRDPVKPVQNQTNTNSTTRKPSNFTTSIMDAMTTTPVTNSDDGVNYVMRAGFNSETKGAKPKGFTVTPTGGKIEISPPPKSTNNGIKIQDNNTAEKSSVAKKFKPAKGIVTIQFQARSEQKDHGFMIALFNSKDEKNPALEVRLTQVGKLGYYNGKHVETFDDYPTGKYIKLKIVANVNTDTFMFFMDDKSVFTKKPFRIKSNDISKIRFSTGKLTTGTFYIDNIKISSD